MHGLVRGGRTHTVDLRKRENTKGKRFLKNIIYMCKTFSHIEIEIVYEYLLSV